METRDNLFKEAKSLMQAPNPHKVSLLYHNIYTLKMGGSYPYNSKEDVLELVDFLNEMEG